jgi:hypothetical protein
MGIMPASASRTVDLPLPERPTKPQELAPGGTETMMFRRAGLSPQAFDTVRSEKHVQLQNWRRSLPGLSTFLLTFLRLHFQKLGL